MSSLVDVDVVKCKSLEVEGERVTGGILDVRTFGAQAGGSQTPEQRAACINAAIDAAASRAAKPTVRIPAASDSSGVRPWIVDRPLNNHAGVEPFPPGGPQPYCIRPRSGVDIIGDGRGATVIQLNGGAHGGDVYVMYPFLESNIRIAHMTLDGNRANYSGDEQSHMICARGTSFLTVEDVDFVECPGDAIKGFGDGPNFPTKFIKIFNVTVKGTNRSGFAILADTFGWKISYVVFEDISDQHIDYEASGQGGVANEIGPGIWFMGGSNHIVLTVSGGTTPSDLTRVFGNYIYGAVEGNGVKRLAFYDNDVFCTFQDLPCLGLTSGLVDSQIYRNRFFNGGIGWAVAFGQRAGVLPRGLSFNDNEIYSAGSGLLLDTVQDTQVMRNIIARTGSQAGTGLAVASVLAGARDIRAQFNDFRGWTNAIAAGGGGMQAVDGLVLSPNNASDCYTAIAFEGPMSGGQPVLGMFGRVQLGPWQLRNVPGPFGGLRWAEPWLEGGLAAGIGSAESNAPAGSYAGFSAPNGLIAARPGSEYRRLYEEASNYGAVEKWFKTGGGLSSSGWQRFLMDPP